MLNIAGGNNGKMSGKGLEGTKNQEEMSRRNKRNANEKAKELRRTPQKSGFDFRVIEQRNVV